MADVSMEVQILPGRVGRNYQESKKYPKISTRAPDTFQRLSYDSRIPFNALWEPKERVSIPVKPNTRRECLADPNLQQAIKTRPRVYMSPSISLDDVKSLEARNTLVNFTYTTISRQANKEVWRDFQPRNMCLLVDIKERRANKLPPMCPILYYLPPGMEKVAIKWDYAQERSTIASEETIRAEDAVCCNAQREAEDEPAEEKKIKQLLSKKELSIIYDKLPLSYGGFRSREGFGVPLQREEPEFSHPNLPISKALYQYHKYQSANG